jgi:hypothetical protein
MMGFQGVPARLFYEIRSIYRKTRPTPCTSATVSGALVSSRQTMSGLGFAKPFSSFVKRRLISLCETGDLHRFKHTSGRTDFSARAVLWSLP